MAKRGRKPKQPSDNGGIFPSPAATGVVRRGRPPKGEGASVSSYFRQVYEERPDLLWTRSNDETLLRWLKDHPGHRKVPERVTKILANLKSVLRRKTGKKRGRKAAVQPAVSTPPPARACSTCLTTSTAAERPWCSSRTTPRWPGAPGAWCA